MDTRSSQPLKGATQVYCPPHYDVCYLFNHSLGFTVRGTFFWDLPKMLIQVFE